MRHRFRPPNSAWLLPGVLGAAFSLAFAQYPGHVDTQKKAAPTLRSVAVLEWTGSPGHPSASRLIPIAVFDGENYQPGGLYLARPAPLALDSGTEYILQAAGIPQGLFDVNTAADVDGSWVGYGAWRNLVLPSVVHKLPNSKNMPQVVRDADTSGPHLNSRSGQSTGSGQNSSDSDSPVLVRRAGSEDGSSSGSGSSQQGTAGTGSASGSSSTGSGTGSNSGSSGNGGSASGQSPAPVDPDRPVLVRRTDDSSTSSSGSSQGGASSGSSSGSSGTGSSGTSNSGGASPSSSAGESAPADPDRPVLRRRSDSSASSAPSYLPQGPETAIGGADPDRPHLNYGSSNPEDSQSFEEPKLTGAPPNLQQMIAVSDAEDREPHPFAYGWSSPSDEAKMKLQMEALAQKALVPPAPTKAPAKPAASKSRTAASRTAAARRSHPPAAPALPPLSNERFAAYQLTYDSGATLVFTAESTPASGKTQYITLIAQPDFYGVPHVIFTSTTTAGMFDLTPAMQLVDVVDVRANNRGDLIFELRSSHARQFAIYRVVEGQVEQVFVTAPMPLSAPQANAAASSS